VRERVSNAGSIVPTLADEQRRRAETCSRQVAKAPTEEHKKYWLEMALHWLVLAKSLDEASASVVEKAESNVTCGA
jgi:hypothetical protein